MQVTSGTASGPVNADQFFASVRGQRLLKAAAETTGIPATELKTRLLAGTSLHDILQSKGATFADVQQTLHGMTGRAVQPARAPATDSKIIETVSTTLRMGKDRLAERLKAGESLSAIAAQQSVSPESLNDALRNAVEATGYAANGAPGVPADSGQGLFDGRA